MDWMDHALCAQVDPDLFHPEKGAIDKTRNAKKICSRCTVKSECLSWAIENPAMLGVLGGTTERERLLLRRRLKNDDAA